MSAPSELSDEVVDRLIARVETSSLPSDTPTARIRRALALYQPARHAFGSKEFQSAATAYLQLKNYLRRLVWQPAPTTYLEWLRRLDAPTETVVAALVAYQKDKSGPFGSIQMAWDGQRVLFSPPGIFDALLFPPPSFDTRCLHGSILSLQANHSVVAGCTDDDVRRMLDAMPATDGWEAPRALLRDLLARAKGAELAAVFASIPNQP